MPITELPRVDEHIVLVEAGLGDVWSALVESLDGTFGRRGSAVYAWAVGCVPPTSSGPRPLVVGSTIPGFAVVSMAPDELVLEGRHRFSAYALTFHLDDLGDRTRLRAETRAEFPGVAGGAYRALVIGTGFHVLGVRRLLDGVCRRAEAA
jgi:hypothetical protein